MTDPPSAHDQLLQRCVSFLQSSGFSNLSMRDIATGVGTSHRMLNYHFGSRAQLLTEIVGRVEADQAMLLAGILDTSADLVEVCRQFWHRITDPDLQPAVRLFFEIAADAGYRRPWTDDFRDTVVRTWEKPLTELLTRHGFAPEPAAARARLALATARGLLQDRLITADAAATDAAAELFFRLLSLPE